MKESLEIKWPWQLIWIEYTEDITTQIKKALPPDHEPQEHDLFPSMKWDRRPIFIVDDDTTGQRILIDFEKRRRWKKTSFMIPTMKVFKDKAEVAEQIERDHSAECAKYVEDGALRMSARPAGPGDA